MVRATMDVARFSGALGCRVYNSDDGPHLGIHGGSVRLLACAICVQAGAVGIRVHLLSIHITVVNACLLPLRSGIPTRGGQQIYIVFRCSSSQPGI